MQSIREYRSWAVLLLVVFAATTVVAATPTQGQFSLTAPTMAPLPATGVRHATPQAQSPARTPKHLGGPNAKTVAFVGAEYAPLATMLRDSLEFYGHTITDIPVVSYTPTIDELMGYEAIVLWSNYAFSDPVAMGDVAAEYADNGGRIVQCVFSWYSSEGWGIGGRIKNETPYQTFNFGSSFDFNDRAEGWYDGSHGITQDMGTYPIHTYYHINTTTVATATELARWDNDMAMVALSENQNVVGINIYPGNDEFAWAGAWGKLFDNAINWTSGPPLNTDVGVAAIRAPGAVQDPGVAVTPLIRIKNYGLNAQSNIPYGMRIWDPSANLVYDQTGTYTGTLNTGDTVSVTLADWTPGSEISYTCTTFTYLAGDEKTRNDTAKKTIATIGWKDIPPPADEPDRLTHGLAYDNDNDMLYMFGGTPNGNTGSNVTRMQRYDPVAMEWTNLAPMPTARGWIHGSYVNGKVYVIGGYSNSGGALDVNEIYDIASNTWSTGAALPRASIAHLEVCYDHRLIYILGGMDASYNAVTTVNVYDPASNSWSTATSMPKTNDMGGATIIGDTIYIPVGYERAMGQSWNNMYKGAINPGDPTQITWTEGPAINPNDACGGVAAVDENVFWVGGFQSNFSTVTDATWKYSQETGIAENYTIAKYASALARNHYAVARQGAASELYIMAGDLGGNWGPPNNMYKVLTLPPKNNDVGIARINVPANAQLTPNSTVTPEACVKNYGRLPQTDVPIRLIITDAAATELYNGTVLVSVPVGESTQAVFPDFVIPDSLFIGRTFSFRSELVGDQRPGNDAKAIKTMTLADEVYSYANAAAPAIDGFMDAGEWDDAFTFDCSNIFGWNGVPQGPGAAYAYFKNDANYAYIAFTLPEATSRDIGDKIGLCIDEDNSGSWNTTLYEGEYQIWVNGSGSDEVQYRYHSPSAIGQWGSVVGSLSSSSTMAGYITFEARIPIGTQPYKLTLNNASNDTVGLYMYGQDGSKYYGWFRGGLPAADWNTPSLYGKLVFKSLQPPGDIGVSDITVPGNQVDTGAAVTPTVKVRNYGNSEWVGPSTAWFMMDDGTDAEIYRQSATVPTVPVGSEVTVTFPVWAPPHVVGPYTMLCSLAVSDLNPANNKLADGFEVTVAPPWPVGWVEVKPVPLTPSGKMVKDGGWLTYNAGAGDAAGAIFLAKGNKTSDFYTYDPYADTWGQKASIPAGMEIKAPYKGAFGVADGNGHIYATKGNNTVGFWKYYVEGDSWIAQATVPLGVSNKKVKGGTGLQYVNRGTEFVYMLKGYKNEFYKFDVAAGTWKTLPDAPIGANVKWNAGSWISYDGDSFIYAHKAKYSELWKFDVTKDSWVMTPTLKGMPLISATGKSKKPKDGGAGAFLQDKIYAFKGGNTDEFWSYSPIGDSWHQEPLIPMIGSMGKKKKVKAGAGLTAVNDAAVFGPKGGKTYEFWRYVPAPTLFANQPREGAMASIFDVRNASLAVSPNPLATGFAVLRYSLPAAGQAKVSVLDVTGRAVKTQNMSLGRSGSATLDLRNLSAGVYLVKIDAGSFSASQKLVVQH